LISCPETVQEVYWPEIVLLVSAYARCDINKDGRFSVNVTLGGKVICCPPSYMGRNLHTF